MHWEKPSSSDQPEPRPYQGVRVKEPVKELLKRKRGNHNNTMVTSPPTVVLPHAALSTYSPVGYSGCMDVGSSGSEPLYTEDGTICTAWIAQPSAATLQPLTHWAPCPEYLPLDGSAPTYTADMYVQPMCPSYAVVGPSSVLTYTSTPLFTNFTEPHKQENHPGIKNAIPWAQDLYFLSQPRHPAPSPISQGELQDPQAQVAYFPWAQPISALPAQAFQCPSAATPFTSPQLVPLPVTVPEPAAQELEEAHRTLGSMPIEKLLQEDQDRDTILHIYTAKGMREYAIVAAEKMSRLRSIDAKEHHGKTALLVAVTANHPYIAHDLIMLGADINMVDDKGQTALHLAATYGFLEVIQVILSTATTIGLEILDFEGHTPLHCAVLTHNSMRRELNHDLTISPERQKELERRIVEVMACIKLLVQAGANVTSQDIKSSKSVLHLTVQEGNYLLLKFFLELNTGKDEDFVNMKAHSNTALHMAAALRNEIYQEEIIKLLLHHAADPSIRNLENEQPIHLVQPGEEGERVRQLLRKGRTGLVHNHRSSSSS
ncbi:NF-kappa-B inhibitor delta isoform X2 [Acipenser ruthenus]|uniref:NF-kappa-B inhibitor delta isoform X2 n=1 Tax=Acipenser ruthenus TaxID=7906 RepID=UPI0027410E94|nr:NF-kappa-B inhibitor delta isoform X2 [Acipenser ruthenus]